MSVSDVKQLIFDLVGPFVVQFEKGDAKQPGTAYVYAPLCDNHHANILTDSDDISIPGNGDSRKSKYVYHFVGGTEPKGAMTYGLLDPDHERALLIVPFGCEPLEGDQCHLMLQIPCPNYIIPLHTERVWIHRNAARNCWVTSPEEQDKQIVDSNRARALRFVYNECPKSPEIDVPEVLRPKSFSAETLGIQGATHYTMTLSYAEAGERSVGQEDAYRCFRNSRAMWSPSKTGCDMSDWRVDFDDLQKFAVEGGGAHPRDCHAPVIVMQDWQQERK